MDTGYSIWTVAVDEYETPVGALVAVIREMQIMFNILLTTVSRFKKKIKEGWKRNCTTPWMGFLEKGVIRVNSLSILQIINQFRVNAKKKEPSKRNGNWRIDLHFYGAMTNCLADKLIERKITITN